MTAQFKNATIGTSGLDIRWNDGASHLFHPLWLRESSSDPEYRDSGTKMRIPQASDIPLDITITKSTVGDDGDLHLVFSDDHQCQFSARDLKNASAKQRPTDLNGERDYWSRGFTGFKTYKFSDLQADEALILDALNEVGRIGFIKVEGIPVEVDALFDFVRLVGPPRETNWGTVADVRNIPNPYDLTMTSRPLSPHVDNPYRFPGPGYIFMHCLRNDADGGVSTIVDGFGIAEKLRAENPEAFEALTTIAPNFKHEEDTAVLEDFGPMIELDHVGAVARIRFSNRTEQVPALDPETLGRYYKARRAFADLIFAQENTFELKLQPGDGFIWDNYRLLHGRTAFDTKTGDRHMRHCYVDRDTVSSRQKCIARAQLSVAAE